MVSHDLKTPLASIKGAAENLLAEIVGPVSDRQRTYLGMILASSENLQQMVANLLDLSRIESGHLHLELEVLDLRREIENVVRSLQPLLEERDLCADTIVEAPTTRVRADRTRLWQILGNLLANAIRYSPAGGRIKIRIEMETGGDCGREPFLRATITDDGPGIPPDEQATIFEPFYARSRSARDKPGAGLGLAIVKQLVELHGGTVELRAVAGAGAGLSITLPQAVAAGAQPTRTPRARPAQPDQPSPAASDARVGRNED